MNTRSALQVEGFFDPATWTVSYIVLDTGTKQCALIDSVLDLAAWPDAPPVLDVVQSLLDPGSVFNTNCRGLNAVLLRAGDWLREWPGAVGSLAPLAASASGAGVLTIVPDHDGILRSMPLVSRIDGHLYPSLGLEALRVYLGEASLRVAIRTESPTGGLPAPCRRFCRSSRRSAT